MIHTARPRRVGVVALGAALVMTALTACYNGGGGGDEGGSEGASIVIVGCGNIVPFCAKENEIYDSAFTEAGYDVTLLLDDFVPADHAANLQQAVAQAPDIIGYVGNFQAAAKAGLEAAKAAGIPVVLLGTPPEESIEGQDLFVSYVGPDENASGVQSAEMITEILTDRGLEGGANVAVITGTGSSFVVQDRLAGFDEQIAKAPGIHVVDVVDGNWDPVAAATAAQQLFAKYPGGDLQVVWAHSGAMAGGVVNAATQAGIAVNSETGLIVLGTNCDATSIASIEAGELWATTSQGPVTDAEAQVETIIAILNGEDVPEFVQTQNDIITAENVPDYAEQCNF